MQLKTFKYFICKVVLEGNRLQKIGIDGKVSTEKRFTTIQKFAIILSIFSIAILNNGFSDNFAGFIIGFLGIFIGLFTSIVISVFDSKKILTKVEKASSLEKARLKKVRNYLVQFTGLTSYSIYIALIIIILLSIVLLDIGLNDDI